MHEDVLDFFWKFELQSNLASFGQFCCGFFLLLGRLEQYLEDEFSFFGNGW